ncbi:MAG: N-acetylmuramoyl-L-alanine amidase [Parabacteroides sp.]|nr:N-acetylmuramoyl-L-alanine amidase [Parabacteroides sp.]
MGFTNSSLISMTRISPNRTSPRNQPITKITVHHMAGVCSIEQFGNIVANPAREMSANYAIGNDGRIGLFCPEGDRSWCSSSPLNDHCSITIEVSNSAYGDASGWPIGEAAYNSLIKLCVDICKRNGIPKLVFTGDKNGSLTFHYMFAATACPGPWMKAHVQDLCDKVNAQLNETHTPTPSPVVENGYTVSLDNGTAIFDNANGKKVSTITNSTKYTIVEDKKVGYITYGRLKSGAGWVVVKDDTPKTSPVAASAVVNNANRIVKNDIVTISANATYYNGNTIPMFVKRDKWYIDSITGDRAVLGRNVSGSMNIQSPISVKFLTKIGNNNTQPQTIKVGDWVKVVNNIIYGTNKHFTVFVPKYKVLELNGKRAVISSDGKNVTTAISTDDIQKI